MTKEGWRPQVEQDFDKLFQDNNKWAQRLGPLLKSVLDPRTIAFEQRGFLNTRMSGNVQEKIDGTNIAVRVTVNMGKNASYQVTVFGSTDSEDSSDDLEINVGGVGRDYFLMKVGGLDRRPNYRKWLMRFGNEIYDSPTS